MGFTFLFQSIRAFTHQPDFLRLVAESPFLGSFAAYGLTPEIFLTLVGIFDALVFLLLILGFYPRTVALHGFAWICIVMFNSFVIGRILETADSMGYLGALLAVLIWDKEEPS